jgi:glycosyltransferase involved in cell wall biosynthesis
MKNISIVIPDLAGGGAQRAAAKLSQVLAQRNNVRMVLLQERKVEYAYGGELVQLGSSSGKKRSTIHQLIYRIRKLGQFKQNNHIFASISFKEGASLVNILSRKQDRVIVSVRTSHYVEKYSLRERLRLRLIYGLYNRADKIVTVSRLLQKEMVTKYGITPDKVEVIYNHYDVESIRELARAPIPTESSSLFDSPVLITAGRLVFQKGHWYLVRAFSEVLREIPGARLIILGRGEMEEDLKTLIRDLDLEPHVHLLGYQDNPFSYISRSSAFVMSSLYEGFPNALCEAMACGIPVLSADCNSGPREILSPFTEFDRVTQKVDYAPYGILTPPFDGETYSALEPLTPAEKSMAEAMTAILKDSGLRASYALKAEERVLELTLEKVLEKWEDLLT